MAEAHFRARCCNSVTVLDFWPVGAPRAEICDKMQVESRLPAKARVRLHALGLFAPLIAFALDRIEQLLAQPDRFRRHLDEFIVLDIG
jgi:hypothetical protein